MKSGPNNYIFQYYVVLRKCKKDRQRTVVYKNIIKEITNFLLKRPETMLILIPVRSFLLGIRYGYAGTRFL